MLAFCSLEIKTQALPSHPGSAASWCFRNGGGGEDPELLESWQEGTVSLSHRQEVARCSPKHKAEGTQRRLIPLEGETQPQVSLGAGAACWWPVGRGAWQSTPGRSNVTGLLLLHPCRGSRWPGCREGVGRPSRGRGMGEETEKAKVGGGGGGGGGGGVCGWPGGCLTSIMCWER